MLNNKGFNLIEITISIGLSAFVIFIAGSVMKSSFRSVKVANSKEEVATSLAEAQRLIRRVGRLSKSCQVVVDSNHNQTLVCRAIRSNDASVLESTVRFSLNGKELRYEEEISPSSWRTISKFTGIDRFTLCSSNSIASATCPIPQLTFATIADLTSNRYFAYRIEGDGFIQSSFYIRDPERIGKYLTYQWFSK